MNKYVNEFCDHRSRCANTTCQLQAPPRPYDLDDVAYSDDIRCAKFRKDGEQEEAPENDGDEKKPLRGTTVVLLGLWKPKKA